MSNKKIRTTAQQLQHEALARSQAPDSPAAARERHRLHRIAQEARMARDATRTVQQARLDLARHLL